METFPLAGVNMVRIIDSGSISAIDTTMVRLLEVCRDPIQETGEEKLPQPVWLSRERGEDNPVWVPNSPTQKESHPALVIDPEGTSSWVITLRIWRRYNSPNPVEKGRILNFLGKKLKTEAQQARLRALLDLPRSEEILEAYRRLPSLPDALCQALRTERISYRLIRYLNRIPDPLDDLLLNILEDRPDLFTVQEMRQLADALRRLPDEDYPNFRSFLETVSEADGELSSEMISDQAQALSYPELKRRTEAFRKEFEALGIDGRIQVEPPQNFEGDYLKFSFRCSRDEELETLAEEIKKCEKLMKHV